MDSIIVSEKKKKNFVLKCCGAKLYKGEKCRGCTPLITTIKDWENSYKDNNNTGNEYEINVGKFILENFSNVLGLYNYTQKDNEGGTADIGIKYYNNDKIYKYSITLGDYKKRSKCIRNPSGKSIYDMNDNEEIKNKNNESYKMAIEYRRKERGEQPNKNWKRVDCPGSKNMCEYLAKIGSENWNKLSFDIKKNRLKTLLDLDNKFKTNCDGIIYWDNKKKCIKAYRWELKIKLNDYLDTYSDGIYIYHGNPDNTILKTQTKYNNGIIEGMPSKLEPNKWKPKKSKNYITSWNCGAPDLSKIFKIEEINLNKLI